ncbi:MAG: SCO family protein [Planctomycetota bacterium]
MNSIRAAGIVIWLLGAAAFLFQSGSPCMAGASLPGGEGPGEGTFAGSAPDRPDPGAGKAWPEPEPGQDGSVGTQDASDDTPPKRDLLEGIGPDAVGVDEKLGQLADLKRTFLDEQGQKVVLADLVDKPTLLLPVYYCCPTACIVMLGGLCSLVNDIPLDLGTDYRIIAFSFDHDETPADAAKAKADFTKVINKTFPPESFRFLTGSRDDIQAVMQSIGYRFKYLEEHAYLHPNALISLAPDGTIIRYLYGPNFLAFDIGMALTEAAKGTPSLSIRKLLTYCFSYNPENKTYTFAAVRYIVIGILILMGLVLFILLRRKPKKA